MDFPNLIKNASLIKIKEQQIGKTIAINFFTIVKTKYGEQYMIYNKKHNVVFYSNSQLYGYLHTFINNLKNKDSYYHKDCELNDIAKFKIVSIEENRTTLKFLNKESTYKTYQIPLSDSDEENNNWVISHD